MPTPKQIGLTVDCPDAGQLAAFWERFLGYTRRPGATAGPYVTIERGNNGTDGPPFVTFQTVPEPKTAKVRLHLDIFVDHARGRSSRLLAIMDAVGRDRDPGPRDDGVQIDHPDVDFSSNVAGPTPTTQKGVPKNRP